MKIRILGQPEGSAFTSMVKAQRYVSEKRACWVRDSRDNIMGIEFRSDSHKHSSSVANRQAGSRVKVRYMEAGDMSMATLDQIAGLPCLKPEELVRKTTGGPRAVRAARLDSAVFVKDGKKVYRA